MTGALCLWQIHTNLLVQKLRFFPIGFSGVLFSLLFEIHQPDVIIAKHLSKDKKTPQEHESCVATSIQVKEKGAKHKRKSVGGWGAKPPEFGFARRKYFQVTKFSKLTDM